MKNREFKRKILEYLQCMDMCARINAAGVNNGAEVDLLSLSELIEENATEDE